VQVSNTVKKQDHLDKDKCKKEKLVNMFDNLGLEDISSSSEDTPISTQTTVKTPTFNTRPNVQYKEEVDAEEDLKFRWFCFMENLLALKDHMCGVWQRYRDGELHLAFAAFIANAAVELVAQEEERILEVSRNIDCALFFIGEQTKTHDDHVRAFWCLFFISDARRRFGGYVIPLPRLTLRFQGKETPATRFVNEEREKDECLLLQTISELTLEEVSILRQISCAYPAYVT
jgi:hypothetical protein